MFDNIVRIVRFPTFLALCLTNLVFSNLIFALLEARRWLRAAGRLAKAPFVLVTRAYKDDERGWERYRARIVEPRIENPMRRNQRAINRWADGADRLTSDEASRLGAVKWITGFITLPVTVLVCLLFLLA